MNIKPPNHIQNLSGVFQWWSATERAEDSSLFDEEVLDVFQPHPNLKSLMVCHFNGGKFPLWLMRMTVVRENDERILLHNVVRIELIDCKRCQQLPTLGHLPFLRVLRIKGLESIKCIGTEFYTHDDCDDRVTSSSDSNHGSSSEALVLFPALRTLEICNFPNLTEWLEPPYPMGMTCTLPFLETLKIRDCPLLTTTPRNFPSLGHLEIQGIISSQPLHNIVIGSQEVILALPSMPRLQSMPRLSYLVIGGCKSKLDEEPEDFPDISPLLGIKSLRALGLVCWPKLKFLPEQLQHFTALGELGINSFDGSEVPEWIGGLLSLYALGFKECWNLKFLPSRSALLRLEKLRCLQIEDCPLLKERCAKDNGPEWHKICHIELIEIDGQPI